MRNIAPNQRVRRRWSADMPEPLTRYGADGDGHRQGMAMLTVRTGVRFMMNPKSPSSMSALSVSSRRRAGTFIAATALALIAAGVSLAASAPSASALARDCVNSANGFVFVPNATRLSARAVAQTPGIAGLYLYSGAINGVQHGWAQYEVAQVRDRVWMDWTRNGGRTWLQCGPFERGVEASPPGSSQYTRQLATPAKRTSNDPNSMFRACGQKLYTGLDRYGPVYCSRWW
jgi:hypothetical protein